MPCPPQPHHLSGQQRMTKSIKLKPEGYRDQGVSGQNKRGALDVCRLLLRNLLHHMLRFKGGDEKEMETASGSLTTSACGSRPNNQ
eukprot:6464886-Amphidinium_carterae.1